MIKEIPLTGKHGKGKYAIVDKQVYKKASKYSWHLNKGYPERTIYNNGAVYHEKLHHLVKGRPPKGFVIDHINRNKLDNRKENLRFCTQLENMYNRGANKEGVSKYKGVSPAERGRWAATIGFEGKQRHIGYYDRERTAAEAYDFYALKYFGEYAFLNFPNEAPTKPEARTYTSIYKGIHFCSRDKLYYAGFSHNKKRFRAGGHGCENNAAKALNKLMREVIGEESKERLLEIEKRCGCCE